MSGSCSGCVGISVSEIVDGHLPYLSNKFYGKNNVDKNDGNIFHSCMRTYLVEKKNKFYGKFSYGFGNFRSEFLDNNMIKPVLVEHSISYGNIRGKIDALFVDGDNKNILVEWKTSVMDYVGFGFGVSNITSEIRNCNYHRAILQTFIYKNILERAGQVKIDEIWIVYFNPLYNNRGGFCITKITMESIFNEISLKILDKNFYFTTPKNYQDIYYNNKKLTDLTPEELSFLKNYIGNSVTVTTSFILNYITTNDITYRFKNDFDIIEIIVSSNLYPEYTNLLNLIQQPEISNATRLLIYHKNLCASCCTKTSKKLLCKKCSLI